MMTVYDNYKYLIDTSPAVAFDKTLLNSKFYQNSCFFPEEILYELRDNPNYTYYLTNEIPITPEVLSFLQTSVLTALDSNRKLLDLYKNQGNGDVFIIATVLAERHKELGRLSMTHWTIVTEDNGVVKAAQKHDIQTLNTKEFLELAKSQL